MRDKRSTFSIVLSLLGVVLLSSVILWMCVSRTSFYGDESGWIASSRHYAHLLVSAPFDWDRWNDNRYGTFASLNPHLGQWLMGFPLAAYYAASGRTPFAEVYNENLSLAENQAAGRIPPPAVLRFARAESAVVALAWVVMVFFIALMISGDVKVGVLAALLVLVCQPFRLAASRAMTDVYFNAFLLLFLLSLLLQRRRGNLDSRRWLRLGAVFAACAFSVKITGLPICLLVFCAFSLYRMWRDGLRRRETAGAAAHFLIVSLLAIFALNPFFWPSFRDFSFGGAARELASAAGKIPEARLSEQGRLPREFAGEYPHLWNLSHPLEFPLMFVRWNRFMNRLASGRSGVPVKFDALWRGNRLATLHTELFVRSSGLAAVAETVFGPSRLLKSAAGLAELVLLLTGIALCFVRPRGGTPGAFPGVEAVAFAFLGNYIFILAFMTVNFDRFYLPAVIAGKLLVAAGAGYLLTLMWAWIRKARAL